jgi:hypothetical protein
MHMYAHRAEECAHGTVCRAANLLDDGELNAEAATAGSGGGPVVACNRGTPIPYGPVAAAAKTKIDAGGAAEIDLRNNDSACGSTPATISRWL